MVRQRVDIQEAAQRLNVSTEALRKRILRGTMESEKDESGRVFVWVDSPDPSPDNDQTSGADQTTEEPGTSSPGYRDALVERLVSEVEFLRDELGKERESNRENRRLLAAALERIPAIEAPPDTPPETSPDERESPVSNEGASYGTSPQEAEESLHRRSWWRRLFGA